MILSGSKSSLLSPDEIDLIPGEGDPEVGYGIFVMPAAVRHDTGKALS